MTQQSETWRIRQSQWEINHCRAEGTNLLAYALGKRGYSCVSEYTPNCVNRPLKRVFEISPLERGVNDRCLGYPSFQTPPLVFIRTQVEIGARSIYKARSPVIEGVRMPLALFIKPLPPNHRQAQ